MDRAKTREACLLALAAASLLFGGGLGCDPELDGVDFRPAIYLDDRYMAFTGKKDPGIGSARLAYALDPPFSLEIRGGVFDPARFEASVGATGFTRLEREDLGELYEMRARYEITPNLGVRVSSNLNATEAFCMGATRVWMRIVDDGMDADLDYDCGTGGGWVPLTSVASSFTVGEKWFPTVGVRNLLKGGQYAFDNYRVGSAAPTSPTPERQVAFSTFDTFRFSLEAYYDLEDDDEASAQTNANIALGALINARSLVINGTADFPDSSAEKELLKLDKSFFKLHQGLFDGKLDKYLKSYPKIADIDACALEDMEDFY